MYPVQTLRSEGGASGSASAQAHWVCLISAGEGTTCDVREDEGKGDLRMVSNFLQRCIILQLEMEDPPKLLEFSRNLAPNIPNASSHDAYHHIVLHTRGFSETPTTHTEGLHISPEPYDLLRADDLFSNLHSSYIF